MVIEIFCRDRLVPTRQTRCVRHEMAHKNPALAIRCELWPELGNGVIKTELTFIGKDQDTEKHLRLRG